MIDLSQLDDLEVEGEIQDPQEEREKWLLERGGRFTCSRFGELMQLDRSKKPDSFGQKAMAYIRQKYAEKLGSFHQFDASALRWGRDNEAGAIAAYEQLTGNLVDSESHRLFVHPHHEYIAGTPDGLVFTDGTIEAKCPFNPAEHIQTLITRKVPKQYEWQVHGHILVTDRGWCDFISFDPRMPKTEVRRLVVIRVNRNEEKIKQLLERLHLAYKKLTEMMGG